MRPYGVILAIGISSRSGQMRLVPPLFRHAFRHRKRVD
jgi:hypothetical protein